jgi:hypothetical protein
MPTSALEVPSSNDVLIPIVLGVVGHREIHPEAIPKLEAALNQLFAEYEQDYPNSLFVIETPLAPGADHLVAKVALARSSEKWSVRAPLACAPEVFRQSTSFQVDSKVPWPQRQFLTAAQRQFDELLKHPRVDWFVVPLPPEFEALIAEAPIPLEQIMAKYDGETEECAEWRRTYYANPGGFIVCHCHTLLALWDLQEAERPSGTAESVRFQLGGLSPAHYPWAEYKPLGFDGDRGPAIIFHAPKPSQSVAGAGERTVRVPSGTDDEYGQYYGRPVALKRIPEWIPVGCRRFAWSVQRLINRIKQAWGSKFHHTAHYEPKKPERITTHAEYSQFVAMCDAIDLYNKEASKVNPNDPAFVERVSKAAAIAREQFPIVETLSTHKTPVGEWFHRFSMVRATAGYLTNRLTRRSDVLRYCVLPFLFVILCVFHYYAHPWMLEGDKATGGHPSLFLGLFFLLWSVLGLCIAYFWYRRIDERRVDYRALAEALRIRQAWALTGLEQSVADTYLAQLRGEMVWVRRALQHLCPPPSYWAQYFAQLSPAQQVKRLRHVDTSWVRDQRRQHNKTRHLNHTKANRHRRGGFLLFMLGMLLLSIPLFNESEHHPPTAPLPAGPPVNEAAPKPVERSFVERVLKNFDPKHPANFVLFFGSMCIIGGGVLVGICEKLGYEQLAKQYDQIYGVFRGGSRELEVVLNPALLDVMRACPTDAPALKADDILKLTSPTPDEEIDVRRAQSIIEELGREAIQESAQWLLTRRSKPLELPIGA